MEWAGNDDAAVAGQPEVERQAEQDVPAGPACELQALQIWKGLRDAATSQSGRTIFTLQLPSGR